MTLRKSSIFYQIFLNKLIEVQGKTVFFFTMNSHRNQQPKFENEQDLWSFAVKKLTLFYEISSKDWKFNTHGHSEEAERYHGFYLKIKEFIGK